VRLPIGEEDDYDVLARSTACDITFVRRIGPPDRGMGLRWDRRVAIKTLRGLDDRALRDIGIVRSQIEAAVDGALNPELARLR
jgi:uncharacterized protein YjiS (DUF1127 family)